MRFSRFLAPLAASLALLATQASAAPVWQINPSGTGLGGAIPLSVAEAGGVGFVQVTPSAFGSFQFVEHGAYQLLQPGTGTAFPAADMTVTYRVSGVGSFLDPTALQFSSGTISLFADAAHDFGTDAAHYGADNGTQIARFNIFGGGATPTGLVTMRALIEAGSLLAGYLFSADGQDLANSPGTSIELGVFNQIISPDALLVSEIVCGLAGYTGPGCDGSPGGFANSPFAFTVRDGGFVSVIAAVPEPGTILLLLTGVAILVCSTLKRRYPGTAMPA